MLKSDLWLQSVKVTMDLWKPLLPLTVFLSMDDNKFHNVEKPSVPVLMLLKCQYLNSHSGNFCGAFSIDFAHSTNTRRKKAFPASSVGDFRKHFTFEHENCPS